MHCPHQGRSRLVGWPMGHEHSPPTRGSAPDHGHQKRHTLGHCCYFLRRSTIMLWTKQHAGSVRPTVLAIINSKTQDLSQCHYQLTSTRFKPIMPFVNSKAPDLNQCHYQLKHTRFKPLMTIISNSDACRRNESLLQATPVQASPKP